MTAEQQLRLAIVDVGRRLYQRGLIVAGDGNISARLPDGTLLITPAGLCKGELTPEDLVVIGLDGELLRAAPGRRQSSEHSYTSTPTAAAQMYRPVCTRTRRRLWH